MAEFPASWALLPVSEVVLNVTLTDKKIPQKSYLQSGKFPVFDQGQEFVGGYTDDVAMVVDCDLPVIIFGDHTRAVKLVNTAFAPGADGVKVLQPSACILPKLLEHFVRYLVTKIPNNGYARHYQHLAKSLLPIPPLAEQHRIVAKIEELFSELDQGVASLKTAREQLKVYRQSLLKNAFAGKLTAAWRAAHADQLETAATLQQRIARERTDRHRLQLADWQTNGQAGPKPKPPKPLPPLTPEELAELPELPAGWGWVRLGCVLDAVSGNTPKGIEQTFGREVPYYRVSDMNREGNELYMNSSATYLSKAEARSLGLAIHPAGTILFPKRGGAIATNKKRRLLVPACFDLNLMGLTNLPNGIELDYLWNWVLSFDLASISDGSNVPQINNRNVEPLGFPVCSLVEQLQIVQELESKLSEADQLDQTLATALQQADALRQSILKKAFCGQLEKQDKNDEPASALLERIRASRGASPAKGRQAKLGNKPLTNC